jgi:hypothetical protein
MMAIFDNYYNVSCGVRDKIKEYHLSLSSVDVVKGDYRIAFTLETNCDQTAMGLPPVTSAYSS